MEVKNLIASMSKVQNVHSFKYMEFPRRKDVVLIDRHVLSRGSEDK